MKVLSQLLYNSSPMGTVLEITDEYTKISANPLTEGVFTGTDGIARLRTYEEFAPYVHLLNGQEVLPDGHISGEVMPGTRVAGILINPVARPETRDAHCEAQFFHSDTTPAELKSIQQGNPFDGSPAYRCHLDKTPGFWKNKPYQERELGPYRFYHYAMVPHGAASTADGAGFNLNSAFESVAPDPDIDFMIKQGAWDLKKIREKITALLGGSADIYVLKDKALTLLLQIGMGIDMLPTPSSELFPAIANSKGHETMTPDQELLLMQSIKTVTETVGALTETVKGLASVEDLKKLQARLDDGDRITQEAAKNADFAAFTEELNAASRVPEIATKLYQEAVGVGQAAWRKSHPELLLKNSSTEADAVLKGTTVAPQMKQSQQIRQAAREKMVEARQKRLDGGA